MDLNTRMAAAARSGGVLHDLTDEQVWLLQGRDWARYVEATGRWVLTDAGMVAADALAEGVR